MKIKKLDSYVEKSIITAMIVSTDFLQGFEFLYKNELFQIPFAKIIARWCWDYYETYSEAPNKTIQALYKKNSEKLDEALCEAIELFLDKLSTEYDRDANFNVDHILNQAEEYFQIRNILALKDTIQVCINNNDIKGAELAIADFNQLDIPGGSGLDLFADINQIAEFFSVDNSNVLFRFKGAAGKIIPALKRKEFIRIDAPEKRGKSFVLTEIAKQATIRGFNVAFFNFEMEEDFWIRFVQTITGSPFDKDDINCRIPFFDCLRNQQGNCDKSINKIQGKIINNSFAAPDNYKACKLCKEQQRKSRYTFIRVISNHLNNKPLLTPTIVIKKINAFHTYTKGNLKVQSWPSDTKSIKDIEQQLLLWEKYEGFIADLILTDYADLMIPDNPKLDYRLGIDSIYKGHKKLGQKFNAAIASATQTKVDTYEKKIKKSSPSESKNKNAHIDRAVALNQSTDEYNKGIIRWSHLFERKAKIMGVDIVVLQQLAIGNAYLDSYIDDFKTEESEEDKPKTRGRR